MTFKCAEPECLAVFEKITSNKNLMNPRCPYCKERKAATKLHRMGDGAVSDEQLMKEKLFKEYMKTDEFQQSLLSKMMSPISQSSQILNKAKDETARIVMEDHKQGDITDKNLQPGDTMAPRLDPVRQKMADGMFGKKKGGPMVGFDLGTGRAVPIGSRNLNMGGIVRAAMSGAYAHGAVDPVAAGQGSRQKMRINYVNKGQN
jgi:hypothetical protein